MIDVFIRRGEATQTDGGHMKLEAETRVTCLQAKGHQGLLVRTRKHTERSWTC